MKLKICRGKNKEKEQFIIPNEELKHMIKNYKAITDYEFIIPNEELKLVAVSQAYLSREQFIIPNEELKHGRSWRDCL